MKQILIICTLLLLLFSCKGKSIETHQKGDFEVEFLFEHDGCKVYRFQDNGRYIYWSNCSGKISYNEIHSSGKTTYTVVQQTLNN